MPGQDLFKDSEFDKPENQQAIADIQETVTATTKLGTAFKTLPSTSNQATNALTNLSRVFIVSAVSVLNPEMSILSLTNLSYI